LAYNAGKFIVNLHCLAHFRVRWFEVAALLAGAYRGTRAEVRPQHPSVKNCREFFEALVPPPVRSQVSILVNGPRWHRRKVEGLRQRFVDNLNHEIGRIVLTYMVEPG